MCVWNSLWVLFHCGHFDRNEISFRVIEYHVNTTRNEILRMSIKISGSFEMQLKWNVMWTELVFTPVWNLRLVWAHFVSHVKVVLVIHCYKVWHRSLMSELIFWIQLVHLFPFHSMRCYHASTLLNVTNFFLLGAPLESRF